MPPPVDLLVTFLGAFPKSRIHHRSAAVVILENLVKEHPEKSALYVAVAENYYVIGDYKKAFDVLCEAKDLGEDLPDIYLSTGKVLNAMGRKSDGLNAFIKMVQSDYLNPERHYVLAMEYLRRVMFEEAVAEFDKTLEINPFHADSYYYLGLISLDTREYDRSLKYFLKSFRINNKRYQVCNNIAALYEKRKNRRKAVYYLRQALVLKPEYEIACFNLGRLLLNDGKKEEA